MKWHTALPFNSAYGLASVEELHAYCKKKKVIPPQVPENCAGTVISVGGRFFILIQKHKKHWDLVDTIIHECVHVHQAILAYAGETVIGDELEAYSVAAIATNILKDYHALHEGRKT